MQSDEEIRRQFEAIIAGLNPGELRDVDQVIAQVQGFARREAQEASTRPSLRRSPRTEPATFTVRVTLNDSRPVIWRRLELRSDLLLMQVHTAIQEAFGWWNYHLHRFAIGAEPFDPTAERFDCQEEVMYEDDGFPLTTEVRLDETIGTPGDVLHYVYDFGDNWDLTIELESINEQEPEMPALIVAGERAAPPEDCGGIRTASELSEVLDDLEAFDVEMANTSLLSPLAGFIDWGVRPEVLAFASMFRWSPDGDEMVLALLSQPRTTPEERIAHLAPITKYLEHVGDGIALTAAGYLKPKDLDAVALFIPSVQGWIHSRTREIDCTVALDFRLALQKFGLLRKAKGTLSCTKAGEKARRGPEFLWNHLASRLLVNDDDEFTRQSHIAYLLAVAIGYEDPNDDAARWLAQLGWTTDHDRVPIEGWVVRRTNDDAREVLTNLSTEPSSWRENAPTPVASDLARAALFR